MLVCIQIPSVNSKFLIYLSTSHWTFLICDTVFLTQTLCFSHTVPSEPWVSLILSFCHRSLFSPSPVNHLSSRFQPVILDSRKLASHIHGYLYLEILEHLTSWSTLTGNSIIVTEGGIICKFNKRWWIRLWELRDEEHKVPILTKPMFC